LFFALLMCTSMLQAQVYDNYPNAYAASDSRIVAWAIQCEVERGYINISNPEQTYTHGEITSNRAFAGAEQDACGAANGLSTVSLGDGGIATVQFQNPIRDGEGYDFVVFENGFFNPPGETSAAFIELAFVEVSSDGLHFFRFNTLSEMPYVSQNSSFLAINWTLFHGFAGVYTHPYGVAFDLADLPDNALLNKQRITHVRVIDVVGCIQPQYASYDSQGNIVNDPWPTPFHTGGFDLDAVGVINEANSSVNNTLSLQVYLYPNPASHNVFVHGVSDPISIEVFDNTGKQLMKIYDSASFSVETLSKGSYIIRIVGNNNEMGNFKLMRY